MSAKIPEGGGGGGGRVSLSGPQTKRIMYVRLFEIGTGVFGLRQILLRTNGII